MSYTYSFSGLSDYFKDMGVKADDPDPDSFATGFVSPVWLAAIYGGGLSWSLDPSVHGTTGSFKFTASDGLGHSFWYKFTYHASLSGYTPTGANGSIELSTGDKYVWSYKLSGGVAINYSFSQVGAPDYAAIGRISFSNDEVVGGTFSKSDFTINDLYSGAVTFNATSADAHFTLNYARGSFSYGIVNGVDRVFGSFGDDMIFGNGGLDNLGGGSKDDVISINGGSLGKLSGGSGFDTLQITGSINLSENILRGFEQIDLGDGKNAITVTLSEESLIWSSVMRGQTLTILGDANDHLNLAGAVRGSLANGYYDYTIDFAGRTMHVNIDSDIVTSVLPVV
jgi:hypothetical protein